MNGRSIASRVRALEVGSKWLKPLSRTFSCQVYEVLDFAVYAPTNEACVEIERIGMVVDRIGRYTDFSACSRVGKRVVQPVSVFLGDVKDPKTGEYGPRFIPYAVADDGEHHASP